MLMKWGRGGQGRPLQDAISAERIRCEESGAALLLVGGGKKRSLLNHYEAQPAQGLEGRSR